MVCKIIFRFKNAVKKKYQMLEALEHPLESPRILKQKKEESASHHMLTWAPPSDRQRGGGVLSTLLTEEPWFFEFSILAFRFSILTFRFLVVEVTIENTFLNVFYAPDTSRCVFLLDFNINCNNFRTLEKCDFLFFSFSNWFSHFCLPFQKSNLWN